MTSDKKSPEPALAAAVYARDAETDALRAELEQVRAERDEYVDAVDSTMSVIFGDNVPEHYEVEHLPIHVMVLLLTIGQLQQERDAAEAKRDQRIAALEAELAETQAAHTRSHEEAADWRRLYTEQVTELAPWREMARQLEALRGKGYVMQLAYENSWEFIMRDFATYSYVCEGRGYASEPEAVNAAYARVVGDE